MEEDWDNDVQVSTGQSFDKSFSKDSEYSKSHRSRDRQASSRDRNRDRSTSNRSRENNGNQKTFELPGNQIGAFIGKGGSNIRNYEAKFDVKLSLDKSSNTVTVSGDSRNISEACDFIQNDLQNRPSRDFGSGNDRPRNGG